MRIMKFTPSAERKYRSPIIHGLKLSYNASIQKWYKDSILNLFLKMEKDVTKNIEKLFRGEAFEIYENLSGSVAMDESIASQSKILMSALNQKYSSLFNSYASIFAEKLVEKEDKASAASLNSSVKKMHPDFSIKTNFSTAGLKEIFKASKFENISQIKKVSAAYLAQIEEAVMRSVTTGQGLADLTPALQKIGDIEENRARLMALDQTRKVFNNINHSRMLSLGFKKFEWLHSGGGQHPREDHIAMDGKIFSFDDLPVIDKRTGERGIPGQAVNCRCTWRPIYEFELNDEGQLSEAA